MLKGFGSFVLFCFFLPIVLLQFLPSVSAMKRWCICMTPWFSYFANLEMSGKGKETEAQRDFSNHPLDSLTSSYMYHTATLLFGKNYEAIKCIREAQINTAVKCVHSKSPYLYFGRGHRKILNVYENSGSFWLKSYIILAALSFVLMDGPASIKGCCFLTKLPHLTNT